MVKTNAPSQVTVDGRTIKTNAMLDSFGELDLVYRPRLEILPATLDQRAGVPILDQAGESCRPRRRLPDHDGPVQAVRRDTRARCPAPGDHAGPPVHALLAWPAGTTSTREMPMSGRPCVARSRAGTTGVFSEGTWPADIVDRDLSDPGFVAKCLRIPLSAATGSTPAGSTTCSPRSPSSTASPSPPRSTAAGRRRRRRRPRSDLRHREGAQAARWAFLIAGYNEIGFLVKNSWGTTWGHKGYATLPYDDWLENGYDAWVGQPGPTARSEPASPGRRPGRDQPHRSDRSEPGEAQDFVVDVTAGGRLSDKGKVASTPAQIAGIVAAMEAQHDAWVATAASPKRRVVLYAHGGLVGEKAISGIADRLIDWWRANRIYPVHIVWESDDHDQLLLPGPPARALPVRRPARRVLGGHG